MTFGESISSVLKNFANFNGRACRAEFWYWELFLVVIILPLSIAAGVVAASSGAESPDVKSIQLISNLVSVATLLPSLGVLIRRLHDVDKSGWWYFIVFTVIGVIPLIYWFCKRGDSGPNRFGDDPLGSEVQGPAIVNAWDS